MLRCEKTMARELTGFCCVFEKNEGAAEKRKVSLLSLFVGSVLSSNYNMREIYGSAT